MHKLLLTSSLILSTLNVMAVDIDHPVFVRHKNKAKGRVVTQRLEDLKTMDAFEGKYFKVVDGKNNDAIKLEHDDFDLVLKAATAYFHLTKARGFYENVLGLESVAHLPQITVRLNISNQADRDYHFAHDNHDPKFNNADSIEGGSAPKEINQLRASLGKDLIKPWQKEIWFRPMKKVRTKDLNPDLGDNPLTTAFKTVQKPLNNFMFNSILYQTLQAMFYPQFFDVNLGQSVLKQGGTVALTYGLIEASKLTDKMFIDKYYYMDTVMMPEVIYHEYSHLVLSDKLKVSHSTPVIEGLADYFAARIANSGHIYKAIKNYSNGSAKKGENKTIYNLYQELNINAHGDLALGILWEVFQAMPEQADSLIYNSRHYLATDTSNLKHGLTSALLESCNKLCANIFDDKFTIRNILEQKGL